MRWVLIRGLAREARHWGAFPQALRAALPDAEVDCVDLPGNGVRNAERSPSTIAGMLRAVRSRAPSPRVHLVGLSLGGMVAAEWAARFPGEVGACVLVNTSMRPVSPWYRRLRLASAPAVLRAALERDATRREADIVSLTTSRGDAALAAAWARFAVDRPVSRANALRQLIAASRYRAPAGVPAVPMLILCSARDRLVDPECSRRMAARWNLPIAEHPDAGHDLPSDDPRWMAARIAEWLRALR